MLADRSVSSQQLNLKLVDIVCRVLTCKQDIASPSVYASWSYYSTSSRPRPRPKEFVCKLFEVFSLLRCEEHLQIVIQSFIQQPYRYPLSTTLVPAAIELHQCMYEGTNAPLYSLLSHCVITLQRITRKDVVGTPTWSNNSDLIMCSCELCTILAAFLNDPARKVARYSVNQSTRPHLERQLAYCSDVTCTTEWAPYTLIVTKNQQSYEARVQRHQAWLALLDRVLPLLKQLEKPSKCFKVDESDLIIVEH